MRTKKLIKVSVLFSVALGLGGFASVRTDVHVDPVLLQENGDIGTAEILAWKRLRAERQVILEQDESAPIVCQDTKGRVFVVTASGKFLTSTDKGQTFDQPRTVILNGKPISEVRAMGVLGTGALLIVHSVGGQLSVARSTDEGKTWQVVHANLKTEGYERLETGQAVRIVQLRDGTVLLPLIGWRDGNKENPEGIICASKDGGKTWLRIGRLGERCRGANILQLKSGALLAALTYQGSRQSGDPAPEIERKELFNNILIARSEDGGRNWSQYRCVTRYRETPADLVELSDGTIILTYGQQNFPSGARAMMSRDEGRTWSAEIYILGFATVWEEWNAGAMTITNPGWFVSSVGVADDVILTLYTRGSFVLTPGSRPITNWYEQNRTLGEKGKAVLAVRWTLKGMDKPDVGLPEVFPGAIVTPNKKGYLDNGRLLLKPEHLNEGGDYLHEGEILLARRIPAEHPVVGPGKNGPVVSLDPEGNPVVSEATGLIYRSTDNGRHWKRISTVPIRSYIQSFGVLRDGTMLAADSRWPDPIHILRSEDGGKTWSQPIRVDPSPFERNGGSNSMRIIQVPDGTVLMASGTLTDTGLKCHQCGQPGKHLLWEGIYRSRDRGKTWGDMSYIGGVRTAESNVLRLKSGRLLVATRTQGAHLPDDVILPVGACYRDNCVFVKNTSLLYSDDNGQTWSRPRTVTRWLECPADLVQTRDGAIIVTYQQKNAPIGARAMLSRDEGQTWDSWFYMLEWWPKAPGHTSSALLRDGRILTVCPDGSSHVRATIWKPLPPEE